MEELLEILNDINSDIDYAVEDKLIDNKLYDSLSIISLISQICDTFDIEIGPKYIRNENFNSAEAMWKMIREIQEAAD
jgi:hypothetical protein